MSQVSCGDLRLGARGIRRLFETLERPVERAVVRTREDILAALAFGAGMTRGRVIPVSVNAMTS
jgi:hypothetical protein